MKVIKKLSEKYGMVCWYCGESGKQLQLDYIVPRAMGGSKKLSNCALSCRDCKRTKPGVMVILGALGRFSGGRSD